MENEAEPRIVRVPSDDEMKAAFDAYALALGRVAHSWNYLHEQLSHLFCDVTLMDAATGHAIWHSSVVDRSQQAMLKAAIQSVAEDRWKATLPTARDDLLWMIERVSNLADARNNAVHAPAAFEIDYERYEMAASRSSGNQRAKNLAGKKLIEEFAWIEWRAEELSRFAQRASTALRFPSRYAWPAKPVLPARGQKRLPKDYNP